MVDLKWSPLPLSHTQWAFIWWSTQSIQQWTAIFYAGWVLFLFCFGSFFINRIYLKNCFCHWYLNYFYLSRLMFKSKCKSMESYPCYQDEETKIAFADYTVTYTDQPPNTWFIVFRWGYHILVNNITPKWYKIFT